METIFFNFIPIRLTNLSRCVKVARLTEVSCCSVVETALTTLHPPVFRTIFVLPVFVR